MTNTVPEHLDNLIRKVMEEWQVPGTALAVTRDGEEDWVKACGLRDVEAGLSGTCDSQFILCSVTKSSRRINPPYVPVQSSAQAKTAYRGPAQGTKQSSRRQKASFDPSVRAHRPPVDQIDRA
jgi:Beta-lactamase